MKHFVTCTRRLQFCAGHRVPLHESKCRHPHGHNYVVHLTAQAPELDKAGRIVDFSVLKWKFGSWIDKNWDHGTVMQEGDTAMASALIAFGAASGFCAKAFTMAEPPTAENMAIFLLELGPRLLRGSGAKLVKVELWETENCFATATMMEGTIVSQEMKS